MPFKIVRNDITKMQVDAIVNTANRAPIYSSGTDSAVYTAAGAEELLAERRKIGFLNEGDAAITPGFRLPAKYIIHTVSPYYEDGKQGEAEKLRDCYEKSLLLALEYGCKSIAFPLIATGGFGYPKAEGMEIALDAIHNFLLKEDMLVYLVVFDKEAVRLSGQIFEDIEAFIDENYVAEKEAAEYGNWEFGTTAFLGDAFLKEIPEPDLEEHSVRAPERIALPPVCYSQTEAPLTTHAGKLMVAKPTAPTRSLQDIVKNVGETFQQRLFRLMDERGMEEVELYKKACKDKKFFHKIRCNVNYQPSKHTVYAFAFALELSLDETKDLLASAGFAFSPSSQFDLIMQYAFEHKIYDLYKIDCILYDFNEKHYFSCE